jgi:hypothetical protein
LSLSVSAPSEWPAFAYFCRCVAIAERPESTEADVPAVGVPSFVPEWWKIGAPDKIRTSDFSLPD